MVMGSAREGGRLNRRQVLIGAAAGAMIGSPAAAGLFGVEPSADLLVRFFDKLALTRRGRRLASVPMWVRKWQASVAVRIVGDATADERSATDQALETVSSFTGLLFHRSDRRVQSANLLTLRFRAHHDMILRHGDGGPVCTTSTNGTGGAIYRGRVDVSRRFADCLRHELMHALGFDNHWSGEGADLRIFSVLAPRYSKARLHDYSSFDEAAIRMLYDPRLQPGMPRAEALTLAREIAAEKWSRWYADAQIRLNTAGG